jgi:hypothetical protein
VAVPDFYLKIRASEQGLEFLQRLAEDDDFRQRLRYEPVTTLRDEYGLEVHATPQAVELPPKEQVLELLADVSGPDETGEYELGPSDAWWRGIWLALEAMPFVAGEAEEGDAAG